MRLDIEITPNLFHYSGVTLANIPSDAIVAIAKVRDEAWRMPFWLAYHRWIGVDHFIVVDNRSQDGTRDILVGEKDVTLLFAPGKFEGPTGYDDWISAIMAASAPGRWNLLLDSDELFVAPPWRKCGLRRTIDALEADDVDVVHALMIDCYPDALPLEGPMVSAVPWQRAPWFDVGPYARWDQRKRRPRLVYYGARQRVFWPKWNWQRHLPKLARKALGIVSPPFIVKAPLFRNSALRGHSIHRAGNPVVRRARGLHFLLHYKLDIDLEKKTEMVIADNLELMEEYLPFRDVGEGAYLHLKCDRSRKFTGYDSLVDARFCPIQTSTVSSDGSHLDANVDIETACREIRQFGGRNLVEMLPVPISNSCA